MTRGIGHVIARDAEPKQTLQLGDVSILDANNWVFCTLIVTVLF